MCFVLQQTKTPTLCHAMIVWRTILSRGGHLPLLLLLFSCRVRFVGADNLGTLRTYQRAGCDDNVVTLRCPPGTSISIELAQYGSSGPSKALCGGGSTSASTEATAKTGDNANISCLLSNAMQYSLLQTVVETCQKKPQCKFQTSPKTFGGDPCPGVRKYVEVAYKCRPYEFRSKIACENEKIQLKCNPNSRVAVYSASYGRTEYESIQCPQTQGVSEETCLVSYATETVMQICHGKRSCELSADATTFGNPCQPKSRMYLKVVYTCVPRKVLKDQYEGRLEADELQSELNAYDDDFDYEHYDTAGNEFIRESAASPPASSSNDRAGSGVNNLTQDTSVTSAKLPPSIESKEADKARSSNPSTPIPTSIPRSRRPHRGHHHRNHHHHTSRLPSRFLTSDCCLTYPYPHVTVTRDSATTAKTLDVAVQNCTVATKVTDGGVRVVGFITNWISTYAFITQNRERFYLYLTVSVGSGVLLCLLLLVIRLLIQRHRDKRDAKFHVTNIIDNAIPNGFADDISEVDADIDLTTPLPVPVGTMSAIAIHPHPIYHQPATPIAQSCTPHHHIHQHHHSALQPSTNQYYYG